MLFSSVPPVSPQINTNTYHIILFYLSIYWPVDPSIIFHPPLPSILLFYSSTHTPVLSWPHIRTPTWEISEENRTAGKKNKKAKKKHLQVY